MCHWYQRERNGNIKNMRCLKSSAEMQNARQQSRPRGCLSALEKPRPFPSVRRSRTTVVRRKRVWRLNISIILAACSYWRLIPISDVGTLCWEWRARRARCGSPLYWCTVEPLLGSLLTLSASSIGTRCQDTEVITPCTRPCAGGILWLSENRLPQILLPRTRPALHAVVATRLSHMASPWLRFAIGEYGFV